MIRMSTTASADFICSKCKKGYTWYADYAGKVAKCTCGGVIQFPFTDPKPKDPLAIPYLPRNIEESGNHGPAPMELPKEDLDAKTLAERRAFSEFYDDAPAPIDPVRDVHGPFGLLAVGLLLLSWQVADMMDGPYAGRFVFGYWLGMTVELALSVLGVMAAGKMMSVYFGKTKPALFKLCSLHIAPSAIGGMISTAMGDDAVGNIVGIGAFILIYYGVFSFIFRFKAGQTLVCAAAALVMKILCVMYIVGAVSSLFLTRGGH